MRDTRRWCGSPGAVSLGQAPAHRPSPARSPPPASPPASRAAGGEHCHRRGRQPPERALGAHGPAPPARKRDRFLLRGSDTLRPPLKQMMSGRVMVHSESQVPFTHSSVRPDLPARLLQSTVGIKTGHEIQSLSFDHLVSPRL